MSNLHALKFNGSSSGVRLTSKCSLYNQSFTKELWMIKYKENTRAIIIGGYQVPGSAGVNIEYTTDNKFRLYWNTGVDFITESSIPIGRWFHLAWVRDVEEDRQLLYIDGEKVWEHNSALPNRTYTEGDYIGRDNRTGITVLEGEVDEFRVWDRALSQEEIVMYMRRKLTGWEQGLVCYLDFDEGEGNIANDLTSNGNDGTLISTTWVESTVDIVESKKLLFIDGKICYVDGESIVYPNIEGELSKEYFDKYGMSTLNNINKDLNIVKYEMDECGKLGKGRVVKTFVDQNNWGVLEMIVGKNLITWNPDDKHPSIELSQEYMVVNIPVVTDYSVVRATQGKTSGKWYWEVVIDSSTRMDTQLFGVTTADTSVSLGVNFSRFTKEKLYRSNGEKVTAGGSKAYATAWKAGDVIGVALDLDNKEVSFYRNGEYQGLAFNDLIDDTYFPCIIHYNASKSTVNFGATPFQYPIPDGYFPYDNDNVWYYLIKHLIKSGNSIYILDNGEWVDTGLLEPLSQEDFETWGMSYLSNISSDKLLELGSKFEVITWTDEESIKVLSQMKGIQDISWSGGGKLFKTTLDDFTDISSIDII